MDFQGHRRAAGQRRRALALVLFALIATVSAVTAAPASATSSGAVAWGENLYRQLGDGGIEASSDVPVAVSDLSVVTAVSAGGRHSLALLGNGTVMAWGDDEFGQLGNGMSETLSNVPVAVSGLSGVTAVSAGANHSLALLGNGTVMAWGENESGQLGDGSTKESDVPVAVKGLTGVIAISAGGSHSLALLKTGTVMAWGENEFGQLGNGSVKASDVPVAVKGGLSGVIAVSAGGSHSLALLKTGTVMAWGDNESGQLGEAPGEEGAVAFSDVPVAVHGVSGASTISAGASFSLALLKTGTAMAWGEDAYGQLGDGRTAGQVEEAAAVSGLSGASAIAAGGDHSVALLGNGTVMAWGGNEWGMLGDGTSGGLSETPVAVSGLSGAEGVSAGGMHTLAYGQPIPTVTHVTPAAGPAAGATSVTITGVELAGATAVRFGSTGAIEFTVNSATSITAVAPAGTGIVNVTVTTPAGTSPGGPAAHFTYLAAPAVKRLAPSAGPAAGGTSVTITGKNLTGATAVDFGSTGAAEFTVDSATSITAVAPAEAAGAVDVTVSTPGGTSATTSADRFKFAPAVTGVSPNSASTSGGASVTLTGSGFAPGTGATTVKFGSATAKTVECTSSSECTVVVPKHAAGTVEVTATVGKQSSPKDPPADQFTYG